MKTRLLTLVLVPSLALMALGVLVVSGYQNELTEAARATNTADIVVEVAELDRALGSEALESTLYVDGQIDWQVIFADSFARTDRLLYDLSSEENKAYYGDELANALAVIEESLAFRSDIYDGYVSPLQITDRYAHLRRILLEALEVEVTQSSSANNARYLSSVAQLAEARSAHLSERIAVGLAIRYDTWAPGQHSAAVSSITAHDSKLRSANSNGMAAFGEIAISPDLQTVRDQISVSNDPPKISAAEWNRITDEWSATLENRILSNAVLVTKEFQAAEDSASTRRNVAVSLILMTIAVSSAIAFQVAMRTAKRVGAIADRAAMLAGGGTKAGTSASNLVGGSDEIRELAEAFDHMAHEIDERESALLVESTALELIANGESTDLIFQKLQPLLRSESRPDATYRFSNVSTGPGSLPANDIDDETYTPLFVVPVGDSPPLTIPLAPQTKSAMGLATLAQRRADDNGMLNKRATRDPLTGLYNRRAILEYADRLNTKNSPALMYADLDGFKHVNDSLGHPAGDAVLKEISDRMVNLTNEIGGRVGRVGGDEFLLVLPNIASEEYLKRVGETLIQLLSIPVHIDTKQAKVGACVGAVMGRRNVTVERLLADSDLALYSAKSQGKGSTVIADVDFRAEMRSSANLASQLKSALKHEEFEPYFQAIWSDDGSKIAALEALVRWRDPSGRVHNPGSFLPILKQQNALGDLDALMFRKVCETLQKWQEAGKQLVPIHLNVAPARLEQANFVEDTLQTLHDTGIAPELMIIEVTESDLMADVLENGARLQELRDVGISIAADDFGQGYSSLSYLRDLPVDILKIDRQFITEIDLSPTNIKIVSAVIGLAKSLGMEVVAEGVEREEEREVLSDHGCDYLQGYLLAKPMPLKETEALMARNADNISSQLVDRMPTLTADSDPAELRASLQALREHLSSSNRSRET